MAWLPYGLRGLGYLVGESDSQRQASAPLLTEARSTPGYAGHLPDRYLNII
jgi:hypothetical protein